MIVTMNNHPDTKKFNKIVIKEGTGSKKPNDGAECTFNVKINGCDISKEDLSIVIGDLDTGFCNLLETSLVTMALGEIAEFDYQFTEEQFSEFLLFLECASSAATNLTKWIRIELELTSFKNFKQSYEMTVDEKYSRALHHKTLGTKFFQNGDIPAAFKKYSLALKYLICMHPEAWIPTELLKDYKKLRSLCYLNLAACQLKYDGFDHVIANCTKSLEYNKHNVKAFYRRGTACFKLGKLEQAKNDFNSGLKLEPNNSTLKQALQQIVS